MSQGDGDRMTQEYFELPDKILESGNLSGREVSGRIDRSPPFYSRVKNRQDLGRSWEVVERGLGISPRTIFAVLTDDVEYDQILAAFGPKDDPKEPDLVSEIGKLEDLIAASPDCRRGSVSDETWRTLEELERRRFKNPGQVEVECRRTVLGTLDKATLDRDEAAGAIGALGIWSTIRRHANDRGSATRGLLQAIRGSTLLDCQRLSGRLLQRAAYLLCDVDQYRPAKLLVERAVQCFANALDFKGFGRALIDSGFVAFAARELKRAESRVLLGVKLIGSSPLDHIFKASAYQLAARAAAVRGKLGTACLYLDEATKFAVANDEHWASIRWCAGTVQLQLGQLNDAEVAMREALQIYLRADKVTDIVMLILDLAMVLVAQDRVREIPMLATHLRPYLEKLSEKDQVRSHIEEAHAYLVRAKHTQALRRFKKQYGAAWRNEFATPQR